jgi:hypothetical protein
MPTLLETLQTSESKQETRFAAAFVQYIPTASQDVCLNFLEHEAMLSVAAFDGIDVDDWIDDCSASTQKSALKTGHQNCLKSLGKYLMNKSARSGPKLKTADNLRDTLRAKGALVSSSKLTNLVQLYNSSYQHPCAMYDM